MAEAVPNDVSKSWTSTVVCVSRKDQRRQAFKKSKSSSASVSK